MPGLDDAIKEIREVGEWNRKQEEMREEVKALARKHKRTILTEFVQAALDNHRILQYDGIFRFIDEYLDKE